MHIEAQIRKAQAFRKMHDRPNILLLPNSISKLKRTRRRAADSAHAWQGEADKVILDLEME